MNRENSDVRTNAHEHLMDGITEILLTDGLKATTMDDVAAKLKISKRTLYELFSSKANMVQLALNNLHKQLLETNMQIMQESGNVIETLLKGFIHYRSVMKHINADFFKDLDESYPTERSNCADSKEVYYNNFVNILNSGVEQGYIRNEINFHVCCRMVGVQMESLKRMENIFPPDISLLEVYDSICIGTLRSIATPKGHKLLDTLLPQILTNNPYKS